jgi:uncharacterized protein YndB with AHSA1/START domain
MDNSNRSVVKGERMRDSDEPGTQDAVRREVTIEASPEEVWESLATEDGRERWLADGDERDVRIVLADQPERLVWWWRSGGRETRVEFRVVAVPEGARVVVTETMPSFPLATLASALALVPA